MRAFNAAWIEPPAITAFRARGDWAGGTNEIAPPGTSLDVFYWPLARDGEGKRGRTRGAAFMPVAVVPVICIEGVAGYIALSHVLVISEGS